MEKNKSTQSTHNASSKNKLNNPQEEILNKKRNRANSNDNQTKNTNKINKGNQKQTILPKIIFLFLILS